MNHGTKRARIAALLGDPSGIGPEVMVKLLAREANRAAAEILLIADPAALASGQQIAGAPLEALRVDRLEDVRFEPGRVTLLAQDVLRGDPPALGECRAASGRAALQALDEATRAVQHGLADAIVFAPLNKHALRLGGMTHEDELRYLQERFGVRGFVCEFNITKGLWTSRVSSHVPLREVARLVTRESVGNAVAIIDGALRQSGIAVPRIAVSGLNPHAGDGGSIGSEEIEIIEPAVQELRGRGLDVRGPYSPDTIFLAARRGDFDAVVSMYHDQGQIAMKLMGFDEGVTLHGGLPVPVATCASGSAFDIAGRGVAKIGGLQAAFDLCARMAARPPASAA
ncbi:4-hydroxythreonine-4-phosphate dehydrogenase PdxA [Ramlibacter sp.]|uniref:4-hydroxythreonine-4-phosphate dehydrogenase PdxA n=1 Tax=Ramlibacter sp. TaxID=1917967 RepID=UPI002C71036A|nr:4-hydroxythreonine-4-phosphate dehydrogenase PdxA [Ramlibacter sp.]HWI83540.1 4-hydroxythreonine-4-phosphate dehydrogenase PdxA [Ramlibacter sp.]